MSQTNTKSTKSRRLKHFRQVHTLLINCPLDVSHLQETLISNVDPFVTIQLKNRLAGHAVATEVKRIAADATIVSRSGDLLTVELSLHIHHYTNLMFDASAYAAKINSELKLKAGSVGVLPQVSNSMVTNLKLSTPSFTPPVLVRQARTKSFFSSE